MSLINKEALIAAAKVRCEGCYNRKGTFCRACETQDMLDLIEDQPTVEQPRCCGCAYYEGENDSVHGICINPKCGKSWYGCPVKSDFFCGHWESREENHETD